MLRIISISLLVVFLFTFTSIGLGLPTTQLNTGEAKGEVKPRDIVKSVAFSPSGRLLASGHRSLNDGGVVRLWDLQSKQCLATLEGDKTPIVVDGVRVGDIWTVGSVEAVVFSPDGRLIASAPDDKTVRLWDVESRTCIGTLAGHSNEVMSLAISSDGRFLAAGARGDEGPDTVSLWDIDKRERVDTIQDYGGWRSSLAFSPTSNILAFPVKRSSIWLLDVDIGLLTAIIEEGSSHVAFSPDGSILAFSGVDEVKLWSVGEGRLIGTLKGEFRWHISCIAISPDGKFLAASAFDEEKIILWDLEKKEPILTLQKKVGPVAFSPDGKLFVGGGYDGIITLWDISALNTGGKPSVPEPGKAVTPQGKSFTTWGAIKKLVIIR